MNKTPNQSCFHCLMNLNGLLSTDLNSGKLLKQKFYDRILIVIYK
jgi:hypothetical protein